MKTIIIGLILACLAGCNDPNKMYLSKPIVSKIDPVEAMSTRFYLVAEDGSYCETDAGRYAAQKIGYRYTCRIWEREGESHW
jgi:hypothetical protein